MDEGSGLLMNGGIVAVPVRWMGVGRKLLITTDRRPAVERRKGKFHVRFTPYICQSN